MITVLSPFRSPRLSYVLDFVFGEFLNRPYVLKGPGEPIAPDEFVIAYGIDVPKVSHGIRIYNGRLCAEDGLRQNLPGMTELDGLPLLFPAGNNAGFPCDPFSLVFFVLSRYEEYLITRRDQHGRFCGKDSMFTAFLDRPFLDEWLLKFEKILPADEVSPQPQERKSRWSNTIDMDIAFAFRGRRFIRKWGGVVKDLISGDRQRLKMRRQVIRGQRPDPFDTYDFIERTATAAFDHRFFIPCGHLSEYDINLDVEQPEVRELINKVSGWAQVGLHPSYRSFEEPKRISTEKQMLEDVLGRDVIDSRQHFLLMKLPETYRQLEGAGIHRDFSMGFHDRIGFRSGTAYPHAFYDLESESELRVRIIPLHAMDSAMRVYMGLEPDSALKAMCSLFTSTAASGGVFTTVWHNHSLSNMWEWEGWQQVYQGFAEFVTETHING